MFNPLVDSFENLTDNEIDEAIRGLSQRYFQTNNPQLQHQISTVLEMYKQEMQARSARQMQQMQNNGEEGLDNLINVS